MSTVDEILQAALHLTDEQREFVAARLYDSLGGDQATGVDEAELLAELERRRADYEAGREEAIPWDQAREEIVRDPYAEE